MKRWIQCLVLLAFLISGLSQGIAAEPDLPKKKQTALGLYVTAREAHARWHIASGKIHVIDVRTPEEYIFVGHAPAAVNIPLSFVKYLWDVDNGRPVMIRNAAFVSEVKKRFKPTDTLFVMCRSGGRSAAAVNLLAEAGFETVYNVVDGFEGDKVSDPNSYFNGKRVVNGWKNSGAPWTYDLNPGLMYLP